ncbi:hypothetical protein F5B20DRAFT_524697 [Whalleya microplaca]|nr:hypothetical protein F5B20DRAFT_524697 [Whalleya microplaca]
MAPLLNHRPSISSSEFSDVVSTQDSIHHSDMASDAPPLSPAPPAPPAPALNQEEYTDDHIRMLYEIIQRAGDILSELTPSSRLPTHALFKAYDEILPEYGIDPDEDQHISKLVFKVGGVKNVDSLWEKFKIVMARMGITVEWDNPTVDGSNAGDVTADPAYPPDNVTISDDNDGRHVMDRDMYREIEQEEDIYSNNDSVYGNGAVPMEQHNSHVTEGDLLNEENPENLSRIEQHLENSAIAFRKIHHSKFSAVAALRQWQQKSTYISNICDQFDAARQADLEENAEAIFESWRGTAARADEIPPEELPPNVYSKRTEGIAVRTHEIRQLKTGLSNWRQRAKEQRRKEQMAVEESVDPLERVAERAHKFMLLSRAFSGWSNRSEEETKKAEMAAKIHEMNLKAKAFGLRRRLAENVPMDAARNVHFAVPPSDNAKESEDVPKAAAIGDTAGSNSLPPPAPTQPGVDTTTGPSSLHPPVSTQPGVDTTAGTTSAEDSVGKVVSSKDESDDSVDEMDEKTLLARRHILRMRYYEAWEEYTAENLRKVRDFKAGQEEHRIAQIIPAWRSYAEEAAQDEQSRQRNAERAIVHNRAAKSLPIWRREAQQAAQLYGQVEQYAKRADFYYKVSKALPVWRDNSEQAEKKEGVLELYAKRAEYYNKITKTLPEWRSQAQQAAEQQENVLARYAERADYYYRTRGTLLTWQSLAKEKRKQRLKEAHLETRRIVKKGMGQRCIAQWREKLQPSFERYEVMNANLEDVISNREWNQTAEALDTWRIRAAERREMGSMSDTVTKEKILGRWREASAYKEELQAEANEHWETRATTRALKHWNLATVQLPNRPLMVANALDKKERKLLRSGFEGWYGKTADKLVPVELPNGNYKNVEQVVEEAQRHASQRKARGLFDNWRAATQKKNDEIEDEVYAPTPGRPQILLGSLGRRETTTPLAPVPTRGLFRASESAMRGSVLGGRASRSSRSGRNLRVSWAQ